MALKIVQSEDRKVKFLYLYNVGRISSAVDWLSQRYDKPWLIVGKGPTFDRHTKYDLTQYHTIGLNHVINVLDTEVCHFSDLEALSDSQEGLLRSSQTIVVMPWYPHLNFTPGHKHLFDLAQTIPIIRLLLKQNRLLSYNSSICMRKQKGLANVGVKYFSADVAVSLLAEASIKLIRTVGVDGGTGYATQFNEKDKLANGRSTFSDQFKAIDDIIAKHNIDYKAL